MTNPSLPVISAESPAPLAPMVSGNARPRRVLLLCPPFQPLIISSLAIAQLATLLRSRNIICEESYLHFAFARIIGKEKYNKITDAGSGLKGELLFAESLYGTPADEHTARELDSIYGSSETRSKAINDLANVAMGVVEAAQPELIGMTTSFNQMLPALWLAKLIKERFPQVSIVLGGASCSDPMGQRILDAYPDVNYVVSGYGEQALLSLALGYQPEVPLLRGHQSPPLDDLPIPEYERYLRDAGEFSKEPTLSIAFESSRGCWWGQKNHCTFCGLNGVEMHFTSKSSDRVVKEVRTLWEKYGKHLFATDTIMAREHLKTVIPELGRFDSRPALFYEVKSNMSEADIAALRQANAVTLQPGIESLNTRLLGLLKKGVSTIRNLALLKWCRERGINVMWNLLCAVPGERPEDYDQQLLLFDKIPHFQPPHSVNPVRIDRFSPYFEDYAGYGWERIEPFAEYRILHPSFDDAALMDVAYHFHGIGGVVPGSYLKRLRSATAEWKERFQANDGLFYDPEKGLVRNEGHNGIRYGLDPNLMKIVELTHDVTPVERVLTEAKTHRSILEQLTKVGILYMEGDKVLNLSIRIKPPDF